MLTSASEGLRYFFFSITFTGTRLAQDAFLRATVNSCHSFAAFIAETARNRTPEKNVKRGLETATGNGSADADVCNKLKLQREQAAYDTNISAKGILHIQQSTTM